MTTVDYLVIGSGIAGLTFAIKTAGKFPDRSVLVVTKSDDDESNSKYAQGGVASVSNLYRDSFDKHLQDTLIAGDGLCDPEVVRRVVREGPARIQDLIDWGVHFDLDTQGEPHLGREGGHSEHRIHHHKDHTGQEIEEVLLRQVAKLENLSLLQQHFTIDVITEHQLSAGLPDTPTCFGAYVLNTETGEVETIRARATILATGGIGTLYGHTTNPSIATGDGVAMAYRSRARIRGMEFVQFHPTVLYDNREGKAFLISEAVRGFGAYLRNRKGIRFMPAQDERAELAPRDIVSRAIDRELKVSGESCVFLDCTHLDMPAFRKHFPGIYEECKRCHIAIETDWIPVAPAAHYLCGGIEVDHWGRTSVNNLFACGECSHTGLHGANRLASNSLLETLVYGHAIFAYLSEHEPAMPELDIPDWDDTGTVISREHVLISHNLQRLQALMRDYVGIVRSTRRLKQSMLHLDLIYREVDQLYRESRLEVSLCELRNMVNVAYLIINQSLERRQNRGGFYNMDLD